MLQKLTSVFMVLAHLAMTGCAALFFDETENVRFETVPANAEIRLDGRPVGRTPQLLHLKAKDYAVQLDHPGCDAYHTSINSDVSGGAVAATVLGVLAWGIFEALSLIEGTGIYRDMPDDVFANLNCDIESAWFRLQIIPSSLKPLPAS